MPSDGEQERVGLARRARGDIPPRFCTVVDVEISGETARVWLLTNDAPRLARYQVNFRWEHDGWVESLSAGGFQTGTPQRVRERAQQLELER